MSGDVTRACTCGGPDRAERGGGPDLRAAREILARHENDPAGLMAVLHEAQQAYGYLPESVLEEVAAGRGLALAAVYGVATFFSRLRLTPRGRTEIRVCHGTACYVSGAQRITEAIAEELGVADGGTTEDGEFTLESVACLGCCGLAPVMMIGEKAFGTATPDSSRGAVRKAGGRHDG